MIKALGRLVYPVLFYFYKNLFLRHADIRSNFVRPFVKIDKGVVIEKGAKIYGRVHIGEYTYINESTRLEPNTRSIGKYCSISHSVKIGLGPHPLDRFSTSAVFYSSARGLLLHDLYDEFDDKGYCIIGNDVLIGAGAIVMAGVKVFDGAVIAAGSVVTKDVPPYAIVAGNPARIIRSRFDEDTIYRLLGVKWWDLPISKLKAYAEQGISVHAFLDAIEKEKTHEG